MSNIKSINWKRKPVEGYENAKLVIAIGRNDGGYWLETNKHFAMALWDGTDAEIEFGEKAIEFLVKSMQRMRKPKKRRRGKAR